MEDFDIGFKKSPRNDPIRLAGDTEVGAFVPLLTAHFTSRRFSQALGRRLFQSVTGGRLGAVPGVLVELFRQLSNLPILRFNGLGELFYSLGQLLHGLGQLTVLLQELFFQLCHFAHPFRLICCRYYSRLEQISRIGFRSPS